MNDGEEIVEIMGDAAGQLADRLHFLHVMQLFLEFFPLGDVLFYRDKMGDFSRGFLDRGDGHFLVVKGPVLAPVDQFTLPDAAGQDGVPEFPEKIGVVFAGLEKIRCFAQDFLRGITGHGAKSLVGKKNPPLRVRQNDAIGRGFQGAGLNPHLVFRLLPFSAFLGYHRCVLPMAGRLRDAISISSRLDCVESLPLLFR